MSFLGIDTSNYTSSVALADNNRLLADNRRQLRVKSGELGLRQSEALYQHWENLPELLEPALSFGDIKGIAVSTRPRAQKGSYMPVFNAGCSAARMLASALRLPLYEFSHQEGHIMAAAYMNEVDFSEKLVCAHLSGGTLELVMIENGELKIIGGTKDISYGQLIDRTGLMLGLEFPCGKEIDALALKEKGRGLRSPLSEIHCDGGSLNMSGTENQIREYISKNPDDKEGAAYFLMKAISDSFIRIIKNIGAEQVLVTGGVASSEFLRRSCREYAYIFGQPEYCSDNAAGLALSEGRAPWR